MTGQVIILNNYVENNSLGREFNNATTDALFRLTGVLYRHCAAYKPSTNGDCYFYF